MGVVVHLARGTKDTSGHRSGGARLMGENMLRSKVRKPGEVRSYSTALAIAHFYSILRGRYTIPPLNHNCLATTIQDRSI